MPTAVKDLNDSVERLLDSTLYNLKAAGKISLKKVGKRLWAPAA